MRFLLSEYFPETKICGSSTNANEARKEILLQKPDILFLDISMPFENGIEFAQTIQRLNILIVFVTAHPNHAIDAFKVSAFDYLLKPVQIKDLQQALSRATLHLSEQKQAINLRESIKIRYEGKTLLADVEDIIYISSEGNYSKIHFANRKPITFSKNMKQIQELYFDKLPFFRIHQSFIVNCSKIIEYSPTEVKLTDNTVLPIARQKKAQFLVIIENKY